MKRPKILLLTPGCFDKGGISRFSRYQSQALKVLYGEENLRTMSLLGPNADSIEAPVRVFWHGRENAQGPTSLDRVRFAATALRTAATWKPDVLLSAHVNFSPLLSRMKLLNENTRTVLNVYGLELWSGLSGKRKQHMSMMDVVIADCHATADYVLENALHRTRPTVIWDPVDLGYFSPGRHDSSVNAKYRVPDPSQHRVILSLGRLSTRAKHKGFDRLINAFSKLGPEFDDARLVIAGDGDDKERLKNLAIDLKVEERVTFTGSVNENDLPHIYRSADVFSLVSDKGHGRGEGIPLTPLEAMACGSPIIVGNEDGSQEAVIQGQNGIVISPRSEDEHVAALSKLLRIIRSNPRIRQSARRVAEENFSFEEFTHKHKKLFDDIPS